MWGSSALATLRLAKSWGISPEKLRVVGFTTVWKREYLQHYGRTHVICIFGSVIGAKAAITACNSLRGCLRLVWWRNWYRFLLHQIVIATNKMAAQEDSVLAAAEATGSIVYDQGSKNDLSLDGACLCCFPVCFRVFHLQYFVKLLYADWLQKYRPSRTDLRNVEWIMYVTATCCS